MNGQMGVVEIWYVILALLLWLYVLTDGFDLGVGILCLFEADESRRGVMAHSIEAVWHANQTWLVMLGGVLFGAFPAVYAMVLPALYLPAGLLLFAFMARGVGLELRAEADRKRPWSLLFGWGSVAVTVAHGLLLGGILQGMSFSGLRYTGGAFAWLSPFTVLVCLTLLCLYALLGAAWLVLKTTGELREKARRQGMRWGVAAVLSLVLVLVDIAVSGHLGHLVGRPGESGFSGSFLALIACAVACAAWCLLALARGRERQPFVACASLLAFVFLAFGVNLFPVILPPAGVAADFASPPRMLRIMLAVVGALLPVIFLYNAYQYRVMGGKGETHDEA